MSWWPHFLFLTQCSTIRTVRSKVCTKCYFHKIYFRKTRRRQMSREKSIAVITILLAIALVPLNNSLRVNGETTKLTLGGIALLPTYLFLIPSENSTNQFREWQLLRKCDTPKWHMVLQRPQTELSIQRPTFRQYNGGRPGHNCSKQQHNSAMFRQANIALPQQLSRQSHMDNPWMAKL